MHRSLHPGFEAAACHAPCIPVLKQQHAMHACSSDAHAACPCISHAAALPMLAAVCCCCWLRAAAGCCCWLLAAAGCCCSWLLLCASARLVESLKNFLKILKNPYKKKQACRDARWANAPGSDRPDWAKKTS
jgi:hypothetical protein